MTDAWAYIARTREATARRPAGCVVAASVEAPGMEAANAKEVARWIKGGLTVERVPVDWVRQHLFTTTPYAPAPTHAPPTPSPKDATP